MRKQGLLAARRVHQHLLPRPRPRAFELREVARQLPSSPLGEAEALLDDRSVSG
jgi:hypothetical protein